MHIHVPSNVPVRHLERSTGVMALAGILVAVGLVAFLVTLSRDADQAWRAWVVNWLFFTSISMGAVMVAVVTWLVKAKWNWSVRRVSLSFAAFLPISFVMMLPMLGLGGDYFPWVEMMADDPIVQNKAAYLNMPFLVTRNVIGVLVLFGMAMYCDVHRLLEFKVAQQVEGLVRPIDPDALPEATRRAVSRYERAHAQLGSLADARPVARAVLRHLPEAEAVVFLTTHLELEHATGRMQQRRRILVEPRAE